MRTVCARRRWLPCLVLSLPTASFWYAYSGHLQLREEVLSASLESHRPPLLNGLVMDLGGVVDREGAGAATKTRASLVMVFSDHCAPSRREAVAWKRLLETMRPEGVRLVLVSRQGRKLSSALARTARARGWLCKEARVRDATAFAERTGIAWSPELLVLDSRSRVRLASEQLMPAVEREVRTLVEQAAEKVPR